MAWWRADLGVTLSSGRVSVLADQSGNGDTNRDALGSGGGSAPTIAPGAGYGGKDVITLAADPLLRRGAWSANIATPRTIVLVGEASGTSSFFCNGAGTPDNMLWRSGGDLNFFNGSGFNVHDGGGGVYMATPSVAMFEDAGGAGSPAKLFINDLTNALGTHATILGTAAGLDIGKGCQGVANLTGKIAEVIVFSGILSPGDRAGLAGYFNTTRAYGIAVLS